MHLQEVSFDHIAKIFVKFYPLTTFCLLIEQSTFRNLIGFRGIRFIDYPCACGTLTVIAPRAMWIENIFGICVAFPTTALSHTPWSLRESTHPSYISRRGISASRTTPYLSL